MKYKINIKAFGSHALLLEWPQLIHNDISADVRVKEKLIHHSNLAGLIEMVKGYSSLCLFFDRNISLDSELLISIKSSLNKEVIEESKQDSLVEIRLCYEEELAPDLMIVADALGLAKEELINKHLRGEYRLSFYGFLPGFMYLSGMDKSIAIPRRKDPRQRVPKGSVAIGDTQTGIYPQECPGGWNLIGRTNYNCFDVQANPPCQAQAGDRIKFVRISLSEFDKMTKC